MRAVTAAKGMVIGDELAVSVTTRTVRLGWFAPACRRAATASSAQADCILKSDAGSAHIESPLTLMISLPIGRIIRNRRNKRIDWTELIQRLEQAAN